MAANTSAVIEPRPKRRKIGESCGLCRQKKTRCDGRRPACSSCLVRGLTCEYSTLSMVAVPADTLANLEARLETLESEKRAPTLSHPHQTSGGGLTGRQHEDEPLDETPTARFIRSLWQSANFGLPYKRAFPGEAIDGIINIDESFMILPGRARADHFLDTYERHVYPLFPILHMPSVRRSYSQCWNQEKDQFRCRVDKIVLFAALNMIFGLGCLNSTLEPVETIQERANVFYQRARQLVSLEAADIPSLEIIQYNLLTTLYLLFTKRIHRCHQAVGVAIRTAQSLRLDTFAGTAGNQLSREMARRVWHGCVTIERLVCSLFGRRVTSFADSEVLLPLPIDDEYLSQDGVGSQPPGISSVITAWNTTHQLFGIIESARWVVLPREHVTVSELATVIELNDRIDKIQESSPEHLQRSSRSGRKTESPRDDIFTLQSDAIMVRISYLRLMIMRPCILVAARRSLSANVTADLRTSDRLRNEICHLCVQAAMDAIDVLEMNLFSPIRVMSCIALFTAFSAATVLVAASLVPDLESRYNLPGVRVSRALNVLRNHYWQADGVRNAKEQLEQFIVTVEGIKRQRESSTEYVGTPKATDGSFVNANDEAELHIDLNDPIWSLQWADEMPWMDVPGVMLQ